jgi:hypothetical protein
MWIYFNVKRSGVVCLYNLKLSMTIQELRKFIKIYKYSVKYVYVYDNSNSTLILHSIQCVWRILEDHIKYL